ncbi:uncharacterized protein LOC123268573 [Cotesia glomerata]|uniref:Uncharacterized protein n=1 Tax=Cotesia glomerata TaxID=32391 RepID=A0AAV7I479_COTGL|nr:uncharacterized protein LOC123268573 [Cotesia glomerata]KAH0546144.1 hypothetical protein KQX54_006808 [Cotesia glomerata]
MKLTSAFLILAAVLAVLFIVKPADSCPPKPIRPPEDQMKRWVRTNDEKKSTQNYEDTTWKMQRTNHDKKERYHEIGSQHEFKIDHEEHDVDDYRINKPGRQSHRWVDHIESTVRDESKKSWKPTFSFGKK